MGDAIRKEGGGLKSEGVFPVIHSWPVIRFPDLSTCHRCGFGFPINGSVDGLKILASKWRVVLLCRECIARVGSAQICSYCFSWFTELEKGFLICNMCSRCVHRACLSLHHRNFSHSLFDADNFICIDCCPIPQLRREGFKKPGGSTDRSACRVSLEDMINVGIPIVEKKTITKVKTRGNEVKKVTVAKRSSGLKRKAFDAIHFVKETSYINLTVPDEKMALRLHQTINGSKRVSRNSYPNVVSPFTVPREEQLGYNSVVSIIDSNSIAHHGKIEVSAENKSNLEGRGKSELISTNSTLFKQENGDLMKQIRGCNIGSLEDFSLDDMVGSLKFLDCTDCSSNVGLEFLPCHSFNTRLMNTMLLTKYRFGDSDGEGSSRLQRKSIDAIDPNGVLKKYFRKSWGSGRTMRGNSHSFLSNSPLLKQENGDLMKQNMLCSMSCPRDFFLQEKESSLKFKNSIDKSNTANFTLLSCLSLNTCLESTMPATKYIFTDCDKMGYFKLQQKSVDEIGPGKPMKNYFRKHWDSGRKMMQGNSYSILTNSQLFKRKNRVLMKQNRLCFAGCPGDFSLKEQEGSLKFPDSIDDLNNGGPALSPCHTLNACSDSSMALTKDIFCYGDGEGSSKLQRKSIDAIAYRSMKKYFRKHWSRKKIMIENSESILVDSLLFKESEDLMKQIKGYNTVNLGSFFLNENVCSLQFPDSTNDVSNAGSALLPCHSSNILWNSTSLLTNYSSCDGDGGRSKELQRKPIDTIVSDNMKKYYRKRRDSKRVMQWNSQTISANSPLFKLENVDMMKQARGCSTSYPGDVYLKNDISPKFPNSTDDDSNVESPLLQYLGLNTCSNSKMSLINYRFGDGDEEECSKLHRRSIARIGSDGSLKKYFRKRLGS